MEAGMARLGFAENAKKSFCVMNPTLVSIMKNAITAR